MVLVLRDLKIECRNYIFGESIYRVKPTALEGMGRHKKDAGPVELKVIRRQESSRQRPSATRPWPLESCRLLLGPLPSRRGRPRAKSASPPLRPSHSSSR